MRVAVIAVTMFVVATPSQASESCMTKTEAREHFGSVHIYWHGPDHCWDVMAGRHRLVHRVQPKVERRVRHEDQKPEWREAMSELMTDDTATQPREAQPAIRYDPTDISDARDTPGAGDTANFSNSPGTGDTPDARSVWRDRWVDVVQVVPAIPGSKPEPISASPTLERAPAPIVSPGSVILVFLGLTLTVVIVEVLVRNTIYERRR